MKNVIIRGPLLSMSGYGTHSRQVWRWAKTQNFNLTSQILPWGITPWYLNPDDLDGMVGRILSKTLPGGDPKGYDISVLTSTPHYNLTNESIKKHAKFVLSKNGGDGAITELANLIFS